MAKIFPGLALSNKYYTKTFLCVVFKETIQPRKYTLIFVGCALGSRIALSRYVLKINKFLQSVTMIVTYI